MIEVRVGELTEARAGAIVRPVSTDFSAVNPAMRRLDEVAGPAVREQCQRLGDLPLGSAAITAAGALPADFLIHVVVRSPEENVSPAAVRRALLNGLRRAVEWEIETVAMAPIGVGAGNLDAEESAALMLPILVEHLRSAGHPATVTLVVEDAYQESVFVTAVAHHTLERGAGARS